MAYISKLYRKPSRRVPILPKSVVLQRVLLHLLTPTNREEPIYPLAPGLCTAMAPPPTEIPTLIPGAY